MKGELNLNNRYKDIHKNNTILRVLGKILWTFIVITITIVLYDMYSNINVEEVEPKQENKINTVQANEESKDISLVLEKTSDTVVGISKLQSVDTSFFSLEAAKTYNLGTGVIISKKGYVLTNNHITGGILSKCYITTEDGEEYNASVVWSNENLDLSILKIATTREIISATIGDSDKIKIGQDVYAIGNPLGLEFQRTVTKGIISALNRTIKIEEDNGKSYMEDLIQTDASINSGNSGGPLIDEKGNVIGVTSIKIKEAEGIGFAIPINIIKPIIEKLENEGKFEEASLGIKAIDKEAIQYLDNSIEIKNGIYVTEIINDEKNSEIKKGDIIEKIDEIPINKINELRKYIYSKNIGEEVKLTILRNKKENDIYIKLIKKT